MGFGKFLHTFHANGVRSKYGLWYYKLCKKAHWKASTLSAGSMIAAFAVVIGISVLIGLWWASAPWPVRAICVVGWIMTLGLLIVAAMVVNIMIGIEIDVTVAREDVTFYGVGTIKDNIPSLDVHDPDEQDLYLVITDGYMVHMFKEDSTYEHAVYPSGTISAPRLINAHRYWGWRNL
jgi:hypothetical protein